MNLSFIKVRATQSVNVSQVKQALLLKIVCPRTLGYTLDADGVWRDEAGSAFHCHNHKNVVCAIADDYSGDLKVEYKLAQGCERYTTLDKRVENDVLKGDKRLLIIELENECIVEVIDMNFIASLNSASFEVQRLKTFGFIA